MKSACLVGAALLAMSGYAHCAEPVDRQALFCSNAAVLAEVFSESIHAGQSREASVAKAVATLKGANDQPVDAKEREVRSTGHSNMILI